MPVILRGVPSGHDWGWYANEDPRMHLQSVDQKHDFKVWLESQGVRAFVPEGKIPAKILKALREALENSKTRKFVETNWTRLMVAKHWIDMHVALPNVTLIAYPNTPNRFTRTVDLTAGSPRSTWLPCVQRSLG